MSAGSPKFTVRRIAALSLVSLWLAGCSDTSNPPAPVSSVNGNAPANTNSGMLITPPPKMGTTSTAQQPQIQPVQQPQIQATQQPQIQPVQPVAQQPVDHRPRQRTFIRARRTVVHLDGAVPVNGAGDQLLAAEDPALDEFTAGGGALCYGHVFTYCSGFQGA